jgi:hypothetical protein
MVVTNSAYLKVQNISRACQNAAKTENLPYQKL